MAAQKEQSPRFILIGIILLFSFPPIVYGQTTTVNRDQQDTPPLSAKESQTTYIYPPTDETTVQKAKRLAWWHEAKFGLFIHWGLYAIPADGEWHMRNKKESVAQYAELASQFNPTKFNADEWMQIAQNAGIKYMAVTAKHHDGFAMFDTKATDYSIVKSTPFKRDVLRELSMAAPKHGVRFGVYYSAMADWHHPGGGAGEPHWDPAQNGDIDQYINEIAVKQVYELMHNYGPIGEVWFDNDGSKGMTPERANRIFAVMKNQPGVVVTPRIGSGDFTVQEQRVTPLPPLNPFWEAGITTNGGWGYHDWPAKPIKTLLRKLIDVWSKGGNVLLNVGPNAQGEIPADNIARLGQIGDWLRVNGQAVYGCDAGPFDYLSWGRASRKGNTVYLHVFNWPQDGILKVPGITALRKAYLLADHKNLSYQIQDNHLILKLPQNAPDSIASVIALELDWLPAQLKSLALNKPVIASVGQSTALNAVDNDPDTKWKAGRVSECWIQADLLMPKRVSAIRVGSSFAQIKRFALEYQDGTDWKPVFTDINMAQDTYEKNFLPISARVFRLHILEAAGDLAIGSFELFSPE